jgi:imidazolonepropionase-like amidohydrolase
MGTARLLLAALGLGLATAVPLPAQDLAVRAGLIHTLAGPPIKDGIVLIQGGRIAAIGPADSVKVPLACKVVDAGKGVVMPALVLVDTAESLYRSNDNSPVVPFLEAADGLNPGADFWAECRRAGYGAVHVVPSNDCILGGVGLVVRPHGISLADMLLAAPHIQKISLTKRGMGRIRAVHTLAKAFADHARALAEKARDAREKKEETAAQGKKPAPEKKKLPPAKERNLTDLVQGRGRAFFYCANAADVRTAAALARKYGFHLVPILGNAAWKAAPLLKKFGLPAIVEPRMEFTETDPETGEEEVVCPAAKLHAAGVPFAITTRSRGALPERFPLWQAAVAVRNGVPPRVALEALTVIPARMLGLEKRLGTLEKGKDGNLLILTGDPLAVETWVDRLIVTGRPIYSRLEDPRLKEIFPPKPAKAPKKKPGAKKEGRGK